MANTVPKRQWILLIHQLPPKPTNLRVRIWRKLQKIGAIAIKNSVYVLPATERTHEDFQWLKQEIQSAGGEAAVFVAGSVEGATDEEIIAAFRRVRDEEFAAISAAFDGLTGTIREQARGKHLSAGRLAAHEAELDKLHAQLEGLIANDFFNAQAGSTAVNAYERSRKAIRLSHPPAVKTSAPSRRGGALDTADYQGCRWVTRRNLHIDRLASAWLIRQFVDKRPRFYFVPEEKPVAGAIPFDMFNAEFSHQGDDCTFETILKRFGLLAVPGLSDFAEIVHDIDLKDDKFNRLEAPGLAAIIDGLSDALRDDRKLLRQTGVIFDGLYALLSKKQRVATTKKRRGRRSGARGIRRN
jgi:hypothetical protein